jgi:hypothetical protein
MHMGELQAQGGFRMQRAGPVRRAEDLSDLRWLIHYLQQRRAQLMTDTQGAFDRRVIDATILLGKLWVAEMNLRLRLT